MIHKTSLTTFEIFAFLFFLFSQLFFLSTNLISLPCTPGKAGDATGCKNCIAGQYQNSIIQTVCLECDEGKASTEGSALCQRCAAGKYVSTKGSSSCFECPQGWKRAEHEDSDICVQCEVGEMTTLNGSTTCSNCDVGFFGSTKGFCSECADGKFTENKGLLECGNCMNGQVNNKKSSCIKCAVGKRGVDSGFGCQDCEPGLYSEDTGQSSCKICKNGEVKSNSSCNDCGLGKHGVIFPAIGCIPCESGKYQNLLGKPDCTICEIGKFANDEKTSCFKPAFTTIADCKDDEYFNNTNNNNDDHECNLCPGGAWCKHPDEKSVRVLKDISPQAGYWRVPWGASNNVSLTFIKCFEPTACLGATKSNSKNNSNLKEGCAENYVGPMCGSCKSDAYRKAASFQCLPCYENQAMSMFFIVGVIVATLSVIIGKKNRVYAVKVFNVFPNNFIFFSFNIFSHYTLLFSLYNCYCSRWW